MSLRTQLAYLAAVLTLIIGLLGLINPFLLLNITGLEVFEPRGVGQARAFFGAMPLTMGGFMLWAVSMRPRRRGVLRLAGFLWLASALGRMLSLVIDGPISLMPIVLFLVELLIGTGALIGALEPPRPKPNRQAAGDDPDDPLRAYRS